MNRHLQETIIHNPEIKLLVVDDREDNLFSIETILEKDNYVIRKASSGREALKILLKEYDFTLILMDVQMPDLNGFETAALIYESNRLKRIPIIFITANDHGEESIFKGYQLGGVDYIYKPINPDLLRAKVAVFVELYKKNMELVIQEQKLTIANKKLETEIEERKASEKKISMLNKQLTENIFQLKLTNQELERYAFVASHDLQEPLRKIIIFGNKLRDKYVQSLDPEAIDYVDRMIKASNRMQMLIKNLLEFSRATADSENYIDTDFNEIVSSIISDLELNIQQKSASVQYGKLPTLRVIPDQFRQLFQNLVANALKFSKPDTTPVILITAEKTKGMYLQGMSYDQYEESFHKITVKDNGIGFDEKYADQIFQIFKRLHTFEQFEGTGIGLSICKKIVEKHRGYIYASGKPNEGATFTIILPVVFSDKPKVPNETITNSEITQK
jgi:signal transduction histidine kinase